MGVFVFGVLFGVMIGVWFVFFCDLSLDFEFLVSEEIEKDEIEEEEIEKKEV